MADKNHKICVCMGSSCFSRGNSRNARVIKDFLIAHNIDDIDPEETDMVGTLCEGLCKEGPIIMLDGVVYKHVTPTALPDLLAYHLLGQG